MSPTTATTFAFTGQKIGLSSHTAVDAEIIIQGAAVIVGAGHSEVLPQKQTRDSAIGRRQVGRPIR